MRVNEKRAMYTHRVLNSPRYMMPRMNRRGLSPSFFCRTDAMRSSISHLLPPIPDTNQNTHKNTQNENKIQTKNPKNIRRKSRNTLLTFLRFSWAPVPNIQHSVAIVVLVIGTSFLKAASAPLSNQFIFQHIFNCGVFVFGTSIAPKLGHNHQRRRFSLFEKEREKRVSQSASHLQWIYL